jgi:hypothetical protein
VSEKSKKSTFYRIFIFLAAGPSSGPNSTARKIANFSAIVSGRRETRGDRLILAGIDTHSQKSGQHSASR